MAPMLCSQSDEEASLMLLRRPKTDDRDHQVYVQPRSEIRFSASTGNTASGIWAPLPLAAPPGCRLAGLILCTVLCSVC
jgi:nitrogen fixation protein FixH